MYARLDSAAHYTFGLCDNYRVLSRSGDRGQERELAMLDFLDKNNIRTTDKTHYGADLRKQLQTLRGKVAENQFAIYEVTFMSDMRVDTVKTLSGFGPELDQELSLILKQARWGSYSSTAGGQRNQVPPGSEHLVAFYYYPAESTFANFIGEYDL